VSFDTRADAPEPRYDLGCRGVIHVLVEPVTGDAGCPLAPLRAVLDSGRARTVGTAYRVDGASFPAIGSRLDERTLVERFPGLRPHLERVTDAGRSVGCELVRGASSCRLLLERLDPPRPLLVFGAGDDARPLVAMAAELGWEVTIVDKRRESLAASRFPAAHHRCCVDPADAPDRVAVGPRTAAVVMTHSLADDVELLPWLLATEAAYVGLLGPKSRTAQLLRRLHERGRLPGPDALDRLHTPVGLDLGASTPPGIALSILAQIVARDNARDGGPLESRDGPIHAPAAHVLVDLDAPRPVAGRAAGTRA
jgi:xanthine/CO dehydrogenase XdhC/CoxF family maturation factor